jgi:predicted lipoprotein with Yx(FWY)xxD motif
MRRWPTRVRASAAVIAVILALAACGGDDDDGDASSSATTTTTGTDDVATSSTTGAASSGADEAVAVAVGTTGLGDTLVDAQGKTLYLFENDSENESTCNEGCMDAWPPLTVTGEVVVGEGLDAAAFTTFARADGTMQVSVNGHPLYTYGGDQNPGDTNGQEVGDVWYAVGTNGEKLEGAQNASTDAGSGY